MNNYVSFSNLFKDIHKKYVRFNFNKLRQINSIVLLIAKYFRRLEMMLCESQIHDHKVSVVNNEQLHLTQLEHTSLRIYSCARRVDKRQKRLFLQYCLRRIISKLIMSATNCRAQKYKNSLKYG